MCTSAAPLTYWAWPPMRPGCCCSLEDIITLDGPFGWYLFDPLVFLGILNCEYWVQYETVIDGEGNVDCHSFALAVRHTDRQWNGDV